MKQSPRAWCEAIFFRKVKNDLILVQIYVEDIIFGSTNNKLNEKFSALM